ncbi:hypothetical protein FNT36_15625 [Hymenobacter setariae]|uniref:Quinol oxidase subunit 4 n=1 Tax=Hymenobacter setariae TaxID=2594794 RepID=A0A558BRF6_9BACT|nr:hypothetical protein [Hymenobacter setariae]TVT39092.1 hypothetical protein FNT36_15625 [Hymenobacter setariae]
MSSPAVLCAGLCVLLLAACGKKPDGTPYGVNPGKLPDGRPRTAADSAAEKHRFRGNKIPKAGEFNAITNGARSGQPILMPQQQ